MGSNETTMKPGMTSSRCLKKNQVTIKSLHKSNLPFVGFAFCYGSRGPLMINTRFCLWFSWWCSIVMLNYHMAGGLSTPKNMWENKVEFGWLLFWHIVRVAGVRVNVSNPLASISGMVYSWNYHKSIHHPYHSLYVPAEHGWRIVRSKYTYIYIHTYRYIYIYLNIHTVCMYK